MTLVEYLLELIGDRQFSSFYVSSVNYLKNTVPLLEQKLLSVRTE